MELLTSLQVAIQTERIQISMSRCGEWEILIRELENLRFEGKSRGTQDDLAFALALAVWWEMRSSTSSNTALFHRRSLGPV